MNSFDLSTLHEKDRLTSEMDATDYQNSSYLQRAQ